MPRENEIVLPVQSAKRTEISAFQSLDLWEGVEMERFGRERLGYYHKLVLSNGDSSDLGVGGCECADLYERGGRSDANRVGIRGPRHTQLHSDRKSARQCRLDGWCGFGFGLSMTNTDMMVAIVQDGEVRVWDMWSRGEEPPVQDSRLGCSMDLTNVNATWSGGVATAVFTRRLDTGDNCDFVIPVNTAFPVIYAHLNSEDFLQHDAYGLGIAVVGQPQSALVVSANTRNTDFHKKAHVISLLFAFACAAPLAVFVARYGKRYWLWFSIHTLLGLYVLITTYVAGLIAFKKDKATSTGLKHSNHYHFRLGTALLSLIFAQALLGVVLKLWVINDTPRIAPLRSFRNVHMILGWGIAALGLVTSYYGIDLYESHDRPYIYAVYGVLGGLFLVAEINHRWIHYFSHRLQGRNTRICHYDDFPYRSQRPPVVVFLDQWVLDIGDFMSSHPGGESLLRLNVTEDVGKYLTGTLGWSREVVAYTHSKYARILVKQHRIGRLAYPEGIIQGQSGAATLDSMVWQLTERSEEADGLIVRFSFTIRNHKIANSPAGVDWMGKHFRLTAIIAGQKVRRYYSMALCLNLGTRNRWIASMQSLGHDVPTVEYVRRAETEEEYMELVVKRYEKGRFSSFIHDMQVGERVQARGPIGPGLRLADNSTGQHLAIAAGTGVLPFLDLIHLLWWKEVNSPDTVVASDVLDGFSLHLILFLRHLGEAIALDLLQAFHAQCESSGSRRFTFTLKVGLRKLEKMEMLGELEVEEVRRVWLCGHAGFGIWVEAILVESGMDRSLIYPF